MENPSVSTENNSSRNETHVNIDEILSHEMENPSVSTENNNSRNETHFNIPEFIELVDGNLACERIQPPILHRVPPQLRENKKHIYDPVVLSLGPYHHNKSSNPKFLRVEGFKNRILNIILDPTARGLFRSKILERVDEIRMFYEGVSIDEYKDEELAEMMLRDTCFLFYYMKTVTGDIKDTQLMHQLGLSVVVFLYRDKYMLENQIPLWVLNLLISLKFHNKDEGEAFFCKFLSSLPFTDPRLTKVPWEKSKGQEPLHLLEALRRIAVDGETSSTTELHPWKIFEFCWRRKKNSQAEGEISSTTEVHHWKIFEFCWRQRKSSQFEIFEELNDPFHSVMDLKTKGIHFEPSSNCLTDIRFGSYWFYGKLQLPIWYINNNSHVFFSNVIALEMSPGNGSDFRVLSYVNFMKSIIESPKDAKELREKGILLSCLNDEEVAKIFKEIDTYGMEEEDIFNEVKMRIKKHCKSRGKTWMAELIHTKFRTPWTVIALLAAIFLLCLTFLQTYYTMNPRNETDFLH